MPSVNNMRNILNRYAIRLSQGCKACSRFPKFPHLCNLIPIKFRVSISISKTVPSLARAISRIVCFCAKKQMVWTDTGSNITFVKDANTFRYRAKMNLPRQSMGTVSNCFANLKFSISSVFVNTCRPNPTPIRLIYTHPKLILQCWVSTIVVWSSATTTFNRFFLFWRPSVSTLFASYRVIHKKSHRRCRTGSFGGNPPATENLSCCRSTSNVPRFYLRDAVMSI